MNLKEKHETFLYPVVRIMCKQSAGSGTLLYSKPDPKNEDEYLNFVLTNHHVVKEMITYEDKWDSVVKREIKKEVLDTPRVEWFTYKNLSTVVSSNRSHADILAYDEEHDLAVLKLHTPIEFVNCAKIIPREKIRDLRLFTNVVVSGCSLAHEPFCNFGQLTYLTEIIEQKKYIMVNAGSYLGNSGGALFLGETGELIGVPSRISGIQLGFGIDLVSFMGFSAHPERIYEFLDEQELQFIYDKTDNYYDSLQRRREKQNETLLALKAEGASKAADEAGSKSNAND